MANILIKHAEIITMNKQEEIIYGDIRIKDNLIVEIGKWPGGAGGRDGN